MTAVAATASFLVTHAPTDAWASSGSSGSSIGYHSSISQSKGSHKISEKRAAEPSVSLKKNSKISYEATYAGDPGAGVQIDVLNDEVVVTGIYKGNQPQGRAGQMLADTVKKAGQSRPKKIKIDWIDNQRTIAELASGKKAEETLLGKTLINAVDELGGSIHGWDVDNRSVKSITATISYP
jgi:hypothetical protein